MRRMLTTPLTVAWAAAVMTLQTGQLLTHGQWSELLSFGSCPGAADGSVIGPPAARLVQANRIEGVPAIGRHADHFADAVCRVAYAS
jgi:hypothetical protein